MRKRTSSPFDAVAPSKPKVTRTYGRQKPKQSKPETNSKIETPKPRQLTDLQKKRQSVTGFACPVDDWQPHVTVTIPVSRTEQITITEEPGITDVRTDDSPLTFTISRERWTTISKILKTEFNERIKAAKLPIGQWKSGTNKVERILGRELILLARTVTSADDHDIPAICASWTRFTPSERWWLSTWITSRTPARAISGITDLMACGRSQDQGSAAWHIDLATNKPLLNV